MKKARSENISLFLIFLCNCLPATWLKHALHVCPNQAKESKQKKIFKMSF
jgi:hypothetical protein